MGLTSDQLSSNEGVSLIVSKIYQRDAISVVSEVYRDFNDLVQTRRGQTESYKNFESRFSAQLSKFDSNGSSIRFPEALTALMLLSNSGVDDSQRISIISSVSTATSSDIAPDASNDAFITSIKYTSVAAIIRQSDRMRGYSIHDTPNGSNTLGANYVTPNSVRPTRRIVTPGGGGGRQNPDSGRNKNRLPPIQLLDLKSKSQCRLCKHYGHWSVDHNPDGTLKPNVRSSVTPATINATPQAASGTSANQATAQHNVNKQPGKTLQFCMTHPIPDPVSATTLSRKIKTPLSKRWTQQLDARLHRNCLTQNRLQLISSTDQTAQPTSINVTKDSVPPRSPLPIKNNGSESSSEDWYESDRDSNSSNRSNDRYTMCAHMTVTNLSAPDKSLLGPMVDDGSPYSAIGSVELSLICHSTPDQICLLYTSPSPRDLSTSRMPSSA